MEFLQGAVANALPVVDWMSEFAVRLVSAAAILVLGWIAAAWAGASLRRVLERAGRLDTTVIPVITSVTRYALLIIVLVAALGRLGVPTTSILAALGAAGLAIGLALQGTLSNIAAGIMLLWLRPFRTGDYIETDSFAGVTREIGLFGTELDTYDGIYRFVPNSEIWNTPLMNYSRNPARMTDMAIGISYSSDIEKARQILLDLARGDERVVSEPESIVFVHSLDDSAVTLRYRVWIRNRDFWPCHRYLLEESKRRFDAAGIEIPFPQRVVHVSTDGPIPLATTDPAAAGESGERPSPASAGAAARIGSESDGG